jgi:hypothetical protein
MDGEAKQSFIREQARRNRRDPQGARILWSRHAITRLVVDDLDRRAIEQALERCALVEDYAASHRPLPDCLVLGWLMSGEPVHAVIGVDMDKGRALIITVYRPSKGEWEDDWRTRKG